MKQTLAGQLTWERTGSAIWVEIPARRGWRAALLALWLIFWLRIGAHPVHALLRDLLDDGTIGFLDGLWLLAWTAITFSVTAAVLWRIGGRTILRLSPSRFDLEWFWFNVHLRTRQFDVEEVRNLRYRAGPGGGPEGSIRFELLQKTHSFAAGLSDEEASALMTLMRRVRPFPTQERVAEYLHPSA